MDSDTMEDESETPEQNSTKEHSGYRSSSLASISFQVESPDIMQDRGEREEGGGGGGEIGLMGDKAEQQRQRQQMHQHQTMKDDYYLDEDDYDSIDNDDFTLMPLALDGESL